MNVHNQKNSCPDEGLSWPETCRRAFIKLHYNKMHLVGFMRYNFITMGGIYIVKKHQMLLPFVHIPDGIHGY
jgi:hypothetical protein